MAKNSIVYILGKALSIIISILLLPLYTSKIPTSSYGYYDLINTLITYGVAVLVLNISVAVLRFGYENPDNKKTLFSTSVIFTFVMSCVATIGVVIANAFYTIKYLPIIISLIFITGFSNLGGAFARCQNKSRLFAYSGLIAGLVNAGVGITCVYVFKMQDLALFLALLFSHLIQALFLLISTKSFKYMSFKSISMKELKRMLVFSSPHAFSLLCAFLCRDIDKTIISGMLGDSTLGVFSMSLKYMGFITAVVDALALAWTDTTFSINDKNDRVSSSIYWVGNMTSVASFVSVLFIPLIFVSYPYLIKGDYAEAFNIIPIIYASVFFIICSGFYANSFLSEKKPIYLMISRLIAASVNLSIVFLLIKKIGIYSIAIGYISSAVVEFFVSYSLARAILKMKFDLKPLLFFFPAYAIVTLMYYFGNPYSNLATAFLLLIILYIIFHEKVNNIIRKIVRKTTGETIPILSAFEKDFTHCKNSFPLSVKIVLITLFNVLSTFIIYSITFALDIIWLLTILIVSALAFTALNYFLGKNIYRHLCFKNKGIYFAIITIFAWILSSIPISFLNDSLFAISKTIFGNTAFLLPLLLFGIYFGLPLFVLEVKKDE